MADDALYQERILALARAARARPALDAPTHSAVADNPVCGDRVRIDIHSDGDRITAIGGKINGCALCEAATGMLFACYDEIHLSEAGATEAAMTEWLKDGKAETVIKEQDAFTPVINFPTRHRCITLPFAALSEIAGGVKSRDS